MDLEDKQDQLTYEDYCRAPEDVRYELVEGSLRMTPSPSTFHQMVSQKLHLLLSEWARGQARGVVFHAPCDVVLDRHNVLQPDLFFVFKERTGIIGEANVQGAPDLVVEILSGPTRRRDEVEKWPVYFRSGVRELWSIDLEAKTIEVAARSGSEILTIGSYPAGAAACSLLLAGLGVDVASLFEYGPEWGDIPQTQGCRQGRLTYEDYCQEPTGLRYELVDGVLRKMESPSTLHQEVSIRLSLALRPLEAQGAGVYYHAPLDVVLDEYNVVQPDLLFVAKRLLYQEHGVRELWLVDLGARMVEVATHNGSELATIGLYEAGTTAVSRLLPDLRVEVNELFRDADSLHGGPAGS